MNSHFVRENTLELTYDTKQTALYQNKNLGTVLSEAVLGSRKRSDLILTLDKLILARYDEQDRVIENSQIITNNDISIQNNTPKIYLTSTKENIEIAEPHNTFYIIKNDFCFVSLSAIRMTSSEAGIAFVGLPNPVGRVNFTLHRAGGTSEPVIWGRTEEGYIYFNHINSTLIGIHAWCSFCYPIAK